MPAVPRAADADADADARSRDGTSGEAAIGPGASEPAAPAEEEEGSDEGGAEVQEVERAIVETVTGVSNAMVLGAREAFLACLV